MIRPTLSSVSEKMAGCVGQCGYVCLTSYQWSVKLDYVLVSPCDSCPSTHEYAGWRRINIMIVGMREHKFVSVFVEGGIYVGTV